VTRVAFIHALRESMAPLDAEMELRWPGCERMHLLDSSLASDLAASPCGLDARLDRRVLQLAEYAADTGADGILFTCSAFGRCIEHAARRLVSLPVLKPNEAMIDEAVAIGRRIGLVATFAPTLPSMVAEFPAGTQLHTAHADGALEALRMGDAATHDRLIANAAERLARDGCDLIALAQFSMARAADVVAHRTGRPVLTTVASAVRRLRERLGATAAP
jgi:Asp/Glu/hydantoin racemase